MTPKQARALLDQRRKDDPLRVYLAEYAGPTVRAFMESGERYRVIDAASRAGKTTALQAETSALLRNCHPFKKRPEGLFRVLVVITRTDQAATVWGKRMFERCELPGEAGARPWIPGWEVAKIHYRPSQKYGRYPAMATLNNGAEYYIALAGDPDSWQSLEGIEFDLIVRDEATGNENLSDELDTRLWGPRTRGEKEGYPWLGGVVWGATATKDNDEFRKFRKRCQNREPRHAYFYLNSTENTSVSQEVRAQAAAVMSKEAHAVRALGIGEMADRTKIYAPHWDEERHVRKEPYVIQPDDNLWVTLDPGWRDAAGILYSVMSRAAPRKIRVVRFDSFRRGGYQAIAECIAKFLDGRKGMQLVCDMAMRQAKQDTGESYFAAFTKFADEFGIQWYREPCFGQGRIEHGHPRVQAMLDNSNNQDELSLEVDPTGTGCDQFIDGMLSYRWRTDHEGNVLNQVHQKSCEVADCLTADTLVLCQRGQVRIDQVVAGDQAWTRRGWRRVLAAWRSSAAAEIMELTSGDGRVLRGTPGHRIWSNGEWHRLDTVKYTDYVLACADADPIQTVNALNGAGASGTPGLERTQPTFGARGSFCTALSGPHTTGQSPRGTAFTTSMRTPGTTTPRTSSACPPATTASCTAATTSSTWPRSGIYPSPGTDLRLVASGTPRTARQSTPSESRGSTNALGARGRLRPCTTRGRSDSAAGDAAPAGETAWGATMSTSCVQVAPPPSEPASTRSGSFAPSRVRSLRVLATREAVFDITVEGEHEFVANGILVHNCIKYLTGRQPVWIDYGPQYARTTTHPHPDDADPYAGLSDEERVHRLRLEESGRLVEESGAESPGERFSTNTMLSLR